MVVMISNKIKTNIPRVRRVRIAKLVRYDTISYRFITGFLRALSGRYPIWRACQGNVTNIIRC